MFTGIVLGTASVVDVTSQGDGARIKVDLGDHAEGVQAGESIAFNGCCLTVTEIDGTVLSFDLGKETLSVTTLGEVKKGGRVNFEKSLKVGDSLGGHFVQGHVDGIGVIDKIVQEGDQTGITVTANTQLLKQIIHKGSITIDGVSLTVNSIDAERFDVWLIPHTLEITTLGERKEGDRVNLELDMIGKWVRKIIFPDSDSDASSSGLSLEQLKQAGFK